MSEDIIKYEEVVQKNFNVKGMNQRRIIFVDYANKLTKGEEMFVQKPICISAHTFLYEFQTNLTVYFIWLIKQANITVTLISVLHIKEKNIQDLFCHKRLNNILR